MSLLQGCFFVFFLAACASFSNEEVIVERSKAQTPSWTELKQEKFIKSDDEYRFHIISDNHADLPLGLKKAQTYALEKHAIALKSLLDENSSQLLSTDRVSEVNKISAFQDIQESVINNSNLRNFKISDIYFEKMRRENAKTDDVYEYYKIHTLMTVSRSSADLMLRDFATRCSRYANNPAIKKFGSDLLSALK